MITSIQIKLHVTVGVPQCLSEMFFTLISEEQFANLAPILVAHSFTYFLDALKALQDQRL